MYATMLILKKMLLLVLLCLSGALSGVDAANRSKLGEFSIILSPVTPAPSTSSSPPTLSLVQSNAIRDTTEVILEAYIESRFSNRPELTELSMLRLGSGGQTVLEEKQAPSQLSSFYSLTMTFTGLIYYTDSTVLIPSDDEIAEYVVEALSQPYLMEVLQADPTLSSLFSDAPPSLWVDHPLVVISSSPSTTPPTENDKEEDTNNNKGLPGLAKVQETPESDSDNSSLNMAAVIGGVVGGIVIVALGAIALVFSNRRRVTDDMTTLEHHHHHRQHTSSSSGDHEHTATDLAAYDVQKIQPESSSASLDRTFDADDDDEEEDMPCSPEDEGDDDTKEAHPSPPPPSSLPSSRLASLVAAAAASFPSSTTSRRGGKSSSIIEAHNATSISSSVAQTSGDSGNDSPPASSQAARATKSASVATSSSHSHHDDQGWDDDAATASSFSSEALRQIQPCLVVPIPSMESFEEQPSRYTLKKDMMMLEGGWSSSLATPKDPTDTSKESSCVLSPTDMSAAGLSGRTSPYEIPEDRLHEDEDVDAVKNRTTKKTSPSNSDFRNFAKERFFPKPARSSAAKSWWRTPKQDDSHHDDANQGSEADSTTLGDPSDLHMWDPDDDKHSVDDGDGAESEVFSETTLPNQDHHQLLSTAVRRESFKLQRLRTPPPKTPKDSDFDSRTNKTDLDPSRFVEL